MTSYSRVYYQAYVVATGKAVSAPTSYDGALAIARAVGELCECAVRFHHADRLTRAAKPNFFDDEISRAIRTTEVVPALTRPDLHNEVAEEGCDRCFCGCKYWEHDRCIDCGTHVSEIRAEQARLDALGPA